MNEQNTFGVRLKEFRKLKRLSGEELGNIMGIKKGQVSTIENDKALPTLEGFIKIISEFEDLNPGWLATGKGEMLGLPLTAERGENKDAGNCWKLLELERVKSETYLSILKENGIKVE